MKYKTLLRIGLQLFGLYNIFLAIMATTRVWPYLSILKAQGLVFASHEMEMLLVALGAILIYALMGFALVFLAGRIVIFFVREEDENLINVSKESVVEVAIIILGVFLITSVIIRLYDSVFYFIYENQIHTLANSLITVIVASILIWKARKITQYILKINTINTD